MQLKLSQWWRVSDDVLHRSDTYKVILIQMLFSCKGENLSNHIDYGGNFPPVIAGWGKLSFLGVKKIRLYHDRKLIGYIYVLAQGKSDLVQGIEPI